MLNHKDKFAHFQLYQQTDSQKLYTATRLKPATGYVVVNEIQKSALKLPVDVHGFINGTHHLEMLEEDREHWYFITTYVEGIPIFDYASHNLDSQNKFTPKNMLQLLEWVRSYDYLSPYYQLIYLNEKQFVLENNILKSKEVLDLSYLSNETNDYKAALTQFSCLMAICIDHLKIQLPEIFAMVNWESVFEKASQYGTLTELSGFWTGIIQKEMGKIKPEFLKELYVVPKPTPPQPIEVKKRRYNPIILATALMALVILIGSNIDYFKNLIDSANNSKSPSTTTAADTTPSSTSPATATPNTPNNTASTQEKLIPDHIQFIEGIWSYDTTIFYTGDRSIKLELTKTNPSASMSLSLPETEGNSSLSMWVRSNSPGTVILRLSLKNNHEEMDTFQSVINFEAADTWYLVNPLSTQHDFNFTGADTLTFTFEGANQTLWIDDILIENYK